MNWGFSPELFEEWAGGSLTGGGIFWRVVDLPSVSSGDEWCKEKGDDGW